jgi:hypothetical protein
MYLHVFAHVCKNTSIHPVRYFLVRNVPVINITIMQTLEGDVALGQNTFSLDYLT